MRYHEIIMANIFCQLRHFPGNDIYRNTGNDTCAVYVEMSIVFAPFRHGGDSVGRYPHEKLLRFFRSQSLYQLVGELIHIDKRNIQFLRYITRRIQIGSMRINQFVSFHHAVFLRSILFGIRVDSFTDIILKNSFCYGFIVGCAEVTAYDGIEQNGDAAFRTGFINELTQVGIESCSRICMAVCSRLLVIMSELDKHIIAFLHL